jgi:hypothetical protein
MSWPCHYFDMMGKSDRQKRLKVEFGSRRLPIYQWRPKLVKCTHLLYVSFPKASQSRHFLLQKFAYGGNGTSSPRPLA